MADKAPNWRTFVKVHAAAELFPLLLDTAPEELDELAASIKERGVRVPLAFYTDEDGVEWLLDGRNRLDALALAGRDVEAFVKNDRPKAMRYTPPDDPNELCVQLNILRRHLNAAQKRELIAKLLKATPERSNTDVAGLAKVDPKTVGAVRQREEEAGTIPKLDRTVGRDGRARTTTPAPRARRNPPPAPSLGADGKDRKQPPGKTVVTAETLEKAAESGLIKLPKDPVKREKAIAKAIAALENPHTDEKPKTVILESFVPDPAADLPLTAAHGETVVTSWRLQAKAAYTALKISERQRFLDWARRNIGLVEPRRTRQDRVAEVASALAAAEAALDLLDREELIIVIERVVSNRRLDEQHAIRAALAPVEELAEHPTTATAADKAEAVDKVETVVEEPAVERTDDEILKLLGRTKWVGPAKVKMLGISEEVIERLLAAGRLRRHPTATANVGLPE
jgi:ParB-like chromosome segregation protein Spo0J